MADSFAPPKLTVTTTLPRDPKLFVRDHNQFLNQAHRDAAEFHHKKHIPRHFQQFAAAKYGYARRGTKYQRLKDKLGLPPLVSPYSRKQGRLPTVVAVMTDYKITATRNKSTLRMRLPFGGGTGRLRVRGGKLTIHQATLLRTLSEIEAIAADEQTALNAQVHDSYAQQIKQPGTKFRVRN